MKTLLKLNRIGLLGLLLILVYVLLPQLSMGQQSKLWNKQLTAIADDNSRPGLLRFKPGLKISPDVLFKEQKAAFDLSENDNMIAYRTEKDTLGFTHTRFHQYYKGVKVEQSDFFIHEKDDMLKTANGKIIPGINLDVNPTYSENDALAAALKSINAEEYLWQNTDAELMVKKQRKNESATYYPKGELVLMSISESDIISASNMHLCWAFDIYTHKPGDANRVYIEAKQGTVLRTIPLSMNCDPSVASGTTTWYGAYNFRVSKSGSNYFLKDDCYTPTWWVRNWNGGSYAEYNDVDNLWNASSNQAAVQSMWGIDKVYWYYKSKFSRNSWDNSNGDLIALNNATISGSVNNACWNCDGNVVTLGAGNTSAPTDDWNTIDCEGHEFTHGVVQATAGLHYNKESGALNESFADIFGTCIERYAEGYANADWTLNEDRNSIIRDFVNPKTYGQPDTYAGTNWYVVTGCTPSNGNDQCGVHTNSGVQNKWFYLLTDGGSGTNDNGDAYSVSGIGIAKAEAIAYRNLSVYLNSTSGFAASRTGSLQAAEDLYGVCSNEAIQVGKAWYAVGVGMGETYYDQLVTGNLGWALFALTYQGVNTLTAGTLNTTVLSGITVTLRAGNKVSVKSPFDAASGSITNIKTDPCSFTAH